MYALPVSTHVRLSWYWATADADDPSFGPLPIKEVERRLATVIDAENVQLTPDGKQALLKLCKGDMRRALNVMQVREVVRGLLLL